MVELILEGVTCIEVRPIHKDERTFCVVKVIDKAYDVYELFFSGDSCTLAQCLRKGSVYDLVLGFKPAFRGSGFRYELKDYREC